MSGTIQRYLERLRKKRPALLLPREGVREYTDNDVADLIRAVPCHYAAPSWGSKVAIISPTKVGTASIVRGTFNLTGAFTGAIYMRAGRLSSSSPSSGIIMRLRRFMYDTSNNRSIPHAGSLAVYQDNTTAGALTALTGTAAQISSGMPAYTISSITYANPCVITTSTNHGFTTGDMVVISSASGYTSINSSGTSPGAWIATVLSATTFSINFNSSAGSGYTANSGSVSWANGVAGTSGTGFAGGTTQQSACCIVDSTSSPTVSEYHWCSKVSSANIYFDSPVQNPNIAATYSVSTYALVPPPMFVTGGDVIVNTPNNQVCFETIFDNGLESTVAYIVDAYYVPLTSIA